MSFFFQNNLLHIKNEQNNQGAHSLSSIRLEKENNQRSRKITMTSLHKNILAGLPLPSGEQILISMQILWGLYSLQNEHEQIYYLVHICSRNSYRLTQMSADLRTCPYFLNHIWAAVRSWKLFGRLQLIRLKKLRPRDHARWAHLISIKKQIHNS